MIDDWHSPEAVIGAFSLWSGVMLGAIRYFFQREMRRFDERLSTIEHLDRRIVVLEHSMQQRGPCQQYAEHLTTARALHSRIDELSRTLNRLEGQVSGAVRAIDLMNEYLINKGGSHGV